MKHTPGPWNIEKEDGEFIAIYSSKSSGSILLADVLDIYGKESKANARLIAAAPDLLEACQYVVRWHREHDSGEGELYGLDFVTTCIGAITKATKE